MHHIKKLTNLGQDGVDPLQLLYWPVVCKADQVCVYGEQLAPVYPHTGGLARHLLTLLTIHILHLITFVPTSVADPDPVIF